MTKFEINVASVALKHRRTKIVATVGPVSSSPAMLDRLIEVGVNVFRLNMSHGDHGAHTKAFRAIRAASKRAGRHVAILADLCGPKIRCGEFEGGSIELRVGEEVVVTTRKVLGRPGLIPSLYKALARDVKKGDPVLLNDGQVGLRVTAVRGDDVRCVVEYGDEVSNRKGINLPGVRISAPTITPKDKRDAAFAVGLGVDYLALSFVRAAKDVIQLRRLLDKAGGTTPVIAKIEKPEALQQIAEILDVADGIMVARGDLGVEIPAERVPVIQNELVREAQVTGRPVIMATQMLESMCHNPRPTRAEVTDVASAAMAGADAVMLSAETATGDYPVDAVRTMDRVLREVEGYQWKHGQFGRLGRREAISTDPLEPDTALSRATALLSRDLFVRAAVVPAHSGHTAFAISSARPAAPVIAITASSSVCRRAELYWGLTAVQVERARLRDPAGVAREVVGSLGLASRGQNVLMVWDSRGPRTRREPAVAILRM